VTATGAANSAEVALDQPIERAKDDKLGRAAFGARLAALIETAPASQGLVIGVAAPWGEGKTSALNLTKEALAPSIASGRVQVVDFNPWLWSGTGHLVEQFFGRLARATAPEPEAAAPKIHWPADLANTLTAYGATFAMLSRVPTEASSALLGAGTLVSVGGFVVSRLKPKPAAAAQKSLVEQRDQVTELLKTAPARLAVFIDDLDRLQDQEIKDVAQLVKLIADFPNVVYVLAYDRSRVEKALGGGGYLEKIVQVPLDLPAPHPQVLAGVLDSAIDGAIKPLPQLGWDLDRWQPIHDDGVFPLLQTARDAKRFANAVVVAGTEVGSEVNGVDLVALTALRVFVPEVYRVMAHDQDLFLGPLIEIGQTGRVERKKRLEELLELVDDRRAAAELILRKLFPQVDGLFTNTEHGWEMWRDDLRICARAMYWRYFTLSLPQGEMREGTLRAAFESSERHDESFERTLLEALAGPASDYFVERFALWVSGLPVQRRLEPIRAVLPHFLSFSDRSQGLRMRSQRTEITLLAYWLLDKTSDRAERLGMALRIARDPSLPAAINLLGYCARGQDGTASVLDEAEVREVGNVILERIRRMTDEDLVAREPYWYLSALNKWGPPDEARTVFARLERSDDMFLRLLQAAIVTDMHRQGGANRIVRRLDIEGLQKYADTDQLREQANRLIERGSLDAGDRAALDLLVDPAPNRGVLS
jgi:KAP family P-loop domain